MQTRTKRRFFAIPIVAITAAMLAALVASVWSPPSDHMIPWDDAYIYARYADHLIAHGRIAWNEMGPASYGLTSLLFLPIVTAFRLLLPGNPALTVQLASASFGFVLVGWLLQMARCVAARAAERGVVLLFTLVALGSALESLLMHFSSGLDTTLSMAYLAAYILAADGFERSPSARSALAFGALGGVAFLARPDLLIFTTVVPLAMIMLPGARDRRRRAALALGLTLGLTGATVTLAALILHSPVPVPFFVKALPPPGSHLRAFYRIFSLHQLAWYAEATRPLWLVIAADFVCSGRRALTRLAALEIGLLAGNVLFVGYCSALVVSILSEGQRFYFPTYPALVFIAAHSVRRLIERVPEGVASTLRGGLLRVISPRPALAGTLLAVLLMPHALISGVVKPIHARWLHQNVAVEPLEQYRRVMRPYWYRLDAFSALPNDLVIATTELGLPAALNPGKEIVDLAGLNDIDLARGRVTRMQLIERRHADLVYMPNPDYREMIHELIADPRFARDYERFTPEQLGATMGVAIRRDSPHYAEMRSIIESAVPVPTHTGADLAGQKPSSTPPRPSPPSRAR